MILLIDNYDSFVHNLARHVGLLGRARRVVRNDCVSVDDIARERPEAIIISPGPCSPAQAGCSNAVIEQLGPHIPILGVCLGHQCIGAVHGGEVTRSPMPVHGRASAISHDGTGLFQNMPSPMMVGRYHSLIVTLGASSPLDVTARTADGTIMAMRHKSFPIYGVQFHPESCLSEHGLGLLENFIILADQWNGNRQ